jgi:hypothetical protein
MILSACLRYSGPEYLRQSVSYLTLYLSRIRDPDKRIGLAHVERTIQVTRPKMRLFLNGIIANWHWVPTVTAMIHTYSDKDFEEIT